MICSTLSGKVAVKHPKLGVLVRDDGSIFTKAKSNKYKTEYHWTYGFSSPNGYLRVSINGKAHYVHRLVAEAFLPNPEYKPTVDHWNRIRTDNRVSNLHWATYKEQAENSSQYEKGFNGIFNRDDHSAYNRAKYHADPEHYREINRRAVKKWKQKHADEVRKRQREYDKKRRQEHPAELREYQRKWRQEHADAVRAKDRERARQRRAAKKQQKAAQ